jgi:hypothetical protein
MTAMRPQPRGAQVALLAHDIDLARHALADQRAIRTFHDFAYEFVPKDATESHVPLHDLQIRRAHPGAANADQGISLTLRRRRRRVIRFQSQLLIENKCSHGRLDYDGRGRHFR